MNNTHQKNITWTCDEGVNINTIHPQRSCKCMWSLGEMFFSLPVILQNVPGQYFLTLPINDFMCWHQLQEPIYQNY